MSLPTYRYEELDAAVLFARDNPDAAHLAANILNVDLWGDHDDEELHDTDIDECIESWIDNIGPIGRPAEIEVVGYRRRVLEANEPSLDPEMILERILEDLDEEYGGDEMTEPTHRMIEFARALASAIRSEYKVWQCEPAHIVKVDVEAWIKANRPDWLPEPHEMPEITDADLEPPTGS